MNELLSLFAVGLLWGITNPFIKRGSAGIKDVRGRNVISKFSGELYYLATNWKYTVPFLINQSGSLLYYFSLKTADLAFAVPITNSIALVITGLTGWFLGESTPGPKTILGSVLVVLGTVCYVLDKR